MMRRGIIHVRLKLHPTPILHAVMYVYLLLHHYTAVRQLDSFHPTWYQ